MKSMRRRNGAARQSRGASEALWYKDAIFYELRVGSFHDGDGDGIGDLRGLTERLDYLQDLGVNALWLLPFYPSPFRDDGYDISDYEDVAPGFGTLDDFRVFLREAHARELRVVTELVINHTSDQHPWFQRARKSPPGSRYRDFYVWSEKPEKYGDARVIFRDFERSNWTWDPVAKAYFWHRFYSHQPDLNFESKAVRKAVLRLLDFWFSMGVDGLRLDAIPYLFERDGTNCENLPETHDFLRELRAHVDARYPHRMLLAEANQWPEDAVSYFGEGDECHMAFHFPVMPRLFMALQMEDRFPIVDILSQTPQIPAVCQWALFLRNHDELTLEMVTDEERDYMYRVYAHDAQARVNLGIRRRLAPLLGNDRRRIELMNALLFALPGTPVIYYGDEIGMGDNIYLGDRNGVRTPMQWSSDRNAGFSRANPQRLYLPVIIDPEYHFESVNVEAQQNNPHSLLLWMKRLIALRKGYKAFGRGTVEFLSPSNRKVLAFIRQFEEQRILLVANLSRFVEYVELDLPGHRGDVAVELFSRKPFPRIGDLPYLLTLGPHSFYLFELHPAEARAGAPGDGERALPRLRVQERWEELLVGEARGSFERALPGALRERRWFGGKSQTIRASTIADAIEIELDEESVWLALVRVEFANGDPQVYSVPLAFARGDHAARIARDRPNALIAEVELAATDPLETGVLYDAVEVPALCTALLDAISRRRELRGEHGSLVSTRSRAFGPLRGDAAEPLPPSVLRAEQSNTSIVYGQRLILKLFRRLTAGTNPDLEIGRFLTDSTEFERTPRVAGAIEYRVPKREPCTVALLQSFVPNEGDAWTYTLDEVERFYETALMRRLAPEEVPVPTASLLELTQQDPTPLVLETMGGYLETARLLGRRTAELHNALASDPENPDFAPLPFDVHYQRGLYQTLRNLTAASLGLLRDRMPRLPPEALPAAEAVLAGEATLLRIFRGIVGHKLGGMRIRCHGDFHLGQVLRTGTDFVIIDFEGEPARGLGERRLKRSPLRDVAGMLRSFDYAAHHALIAGASESALRPEDIPALEPWARLWRQWAGSAFLRAYLAVLSPAELVSTRPAEIELLLGVLLLERNLYELSYEVNNRPGWLRLPLRAMAERIAAA
ncbi:MAG: maltose alpha-D-glucosyltransferase [Myxococcota bacterium]